MNDTFTALTCIDWLSAGLSRVSSRTPVEGVYRDREGRIRLIETDPSYARMVNRAFDKIRQSSRGMPAVVIRMLDALATIGEATNSSEQRAILHRQAAAILRSAEDSVPEANDRADIDGRYRRFAARMAFRDAPPGRSSTLA